MVKDSRASSIGFLRQVGLVVNGRDITDDRAMEVENEKPRR